MSVSIKQLQMLSAHQWRVLLVKHAPLAICALTTVGIAWQASQLTWLFAGGSKVSNAAPIGPVASPAPADARPAVDVQSIANAHLFGLPSADNGADTSNLPQSQIGLILAGTIALNDPMAGYAIVGENAATAKFYAVGGMIGGSARLHSVYADRVIIDRGGKLEALILPRGTPSTSPVNARSAVANNGVGDNLRRLAQNNPSAIGELLRAQPVFSGGSQKGYRVYPGRDRQQFVRLGLQPGDLITSVNGTPLDDPARGNEILNTMNSSSSVAVTVERNGATQQLTLDIAQLSLPDTGSTTATDTNPNANAANTNGTVEPANATPEGGGAGVGPNGSFGPNGGRGPRGNRGGTPPNNPTSGPSAQ